jgi:4-hydroxybenzoate-CoA ligase
VLETLEKLDHIVVVGEGEHGHLVFQQLLNQADAEFKTAKTSPDDTAFWLYSSGSTGDPKGVMHRHSSLIHVARYFGQGVLGIRHDDVCFAAAKLFFAYAQGAAMAIPMSVGATTILMPQRPTPGSILATLHRFNPTLFFGVPTLYAAMLADPACCPENASSHLRLCISAGEALPRDIGQNWQNRMGIDIVDGVGSTEMLNAFLSNRPGEVRYGTSGRDFDGYQLRLVDEDNNEVEGDNLGELLVSGGSSAKGYWNKAEKNRETFQGKWVRTGDKYFRDQDGYYHYCGRTNDMFKVSGRWVSPFEVEQALISHKAVLEAAVVACKDDEGLIKPKAFVVLNNARPRDGLFEILKSHVKTSIGVWKYPRWIEFVDDLPKTTTGKIQRYRLRE